MSEQSRTTLKSYFQTGSVPSQANFGDLIDSFINETDDQVSVDSKHNMGLGFTLPPARLAIAGAAAQVIHEFTLTLHTGNATATIANLLPGVLLNTVVYPGDMIQVAGISQPFTITAVAAQTLQLYPVPAIDVTTAQVTLLKNQFFIGNTSNIGNAGTQVVVTNAGHMGLGILQPQQALDVSGNVQATGFIGNGSQLTNLPAANITGQIPLTALPSLSFENIHGQAAIAQLPSLSFENIHGQLAVSQLPPGFQPVANGIISFNCTAPAIQSGSSVTLSWKINGATAIQLNYLNNYIPTTANASNDPNWVSAGFYTLTPDITQTYTLVALKDTTVLDTAQLTITVIPNVKAFMQKCASTNVPAGSAITGAGQAFNLGILCASNVSLLASAMKGIYPDGNIYQAIPAYYNNLHYTWSPATNGPWIDKIIYPNN